MTVGGPRRPVRLAVVGCGAIGSALLERLRDQPRVEVAAVVVREPRLAVHRERLRRAGHAMPLATRVPADVALVVEVGGHAAIAQHVVPALRAGTDAVLASVGALSDASLHASLQQASDEGGAAFELVSGAIGGLDALAAARLGGLDEVVYTGSKPPAAWAGTPAEAAADLPRLTAATVVFEGSARDAARLFPRNANVAATVAIAGLGFDGTRVCLVADPALARNVHRLQARGAFGELDLRIANLPLAENPRTSALAVWSVLDATLRRTQRTSARD